MKSNWIKNYDALASGKSRQDILAIANAGLEAIDTAAVIKNQIKLDGQKLTIKDQVFDLTKFKRIKVIGFGKVSCKAALAMEEVLGKLIDSGVVIGLAPVACEIIKTYEGTHPQPSDQNVEISEQIMLASRDANEDDLVIVLVSGGGSALLCWPKTECDQGQILYHQFLKAGGTIEELNIIRKHISLLKGGGLAKMLYPATVIGLIFSDVPGDDYTTIASGPTYFDPTTVADAKALIKKYNLTEFDLAETPKDEKLFDKVHNIPLVSNNTALEAMSQKATSLGYKAKVVSNQLYDPAERIIPLLQQSADELPACLVAGGEMKLIVPVSNGTGGRNQHLAMEALKTIQDNETFLFLASDGADNSDCAGAIVDSEFKQKLQALNLNLGDYLNRFDGYNLGKALGNQIFTGPTEANVSDLFIYLKKPVSSRT
jgi:glycerate-2-kinase